MATPTSYLQTLANDEAIAFIASLQKVKTHLNQELQWLKAQVQQKTVQLQGFETFLSEALALGLVTADAHSILTSVAAASSAPIATAIVASHESVETLATASGSSAPSEATDSLAAAIAALPVKPPSTQQRTSQGKAGHVKAPRGSKPSVTTKTTAQAKQPKPSPLPPEKVRQRGKAAGLQRFLQSQWRNKVLTESVGEILNRASESLSTDEVMAELYDGLSKEDYNRAKNSLANILSVGRSKGAWKSTGRGRYSNNAITTA